MNHNQLLETERWQGVRDFVYRRDQGQCVICGAPGLDAHHWSYRWGFFNPKVISLLCRRCHLAWQGRNPDHLADDHLLKVKLMRIAQIARCLGRGQQS